MGRVFRPRGRTILPLLLSLLAGCSRPAGVRSGAETSQPIVPFHEGEDGDLHPDLTTTSADSVVSESGVPFHDSQSLPIGTLLAVRLKDAINSDHPPSAANSTFTALVDEPIIIEGATVVPRGASVAGRIESARSSTIKHARGYVRLTLDLVDISGKELPIRTSSLFARGTASEQQKHGSSQVISEAHNDAVSLEQGRLLIFRLSEPVNLVGPPPESHR
jgi:hypothetical protein